jgi:LAS superfamily LD-carboxypeptidase LdcB
MSTDVPQLTSETLLGLNDTALTALPDLQCQLHINVVEPLLHLCDSAQAAGFFLRVASSYRSFERQRLIWNAKAKGERPVLDDRGQLLDLAVLTDLQKVHAILRWSALPGASRHHWGTDIDVYDGSAVSADYRLQLTLEECCDGGPFVPFHAWLTDTIAAGNSFGFYRPYALDCGGIAPEPWHLSYAPLADEFARQRTEALLRTQIEATDIALKSTILDHFSALYQRYVLIAT